MRTSPRSILGVKTRAVAIVITLVTLGAGGHVWGPHGVSNLSRTVSTAYAAGGCQLSSNHADIRHVIYVQFDNVHFTRDNANVPSDLEQMPHLLNFMQGNGTLLTNHHTPLIAHTATDILTSLTGLYGDRHGVPISNSFRYFNPDGTSNLGVSFAYWTDPLYDPTTATPSDTSYNMLSPARTNTPAPWVPYTRAGCDVGSVATANTVLENINTDIPTVFGANSDQAAEVKAKPDQAFADFVGIGVHCAIGSSVCSSANGARPDLLPGEPGGYSGYSGLFGHKYVAPVISPSGALKDLNNRVIADAKGNVGFPGFDGMSAAVSLGYVAAMQESGIPVTYAYISDAHDNHVAGKAYGPGSAGYVAQLKSYDDAFATFFNRLGNDGIDQSNTLFVFTSDENDHFAGGPPATGCDGVTTPCSYTKIGEVNTNVAGLLATQKGITTSFAVHSDSAPNFYVQGNPAPDAPVTRAIERAAGSLAVTNPITGNQEAVTNYLADPVEMKLLHMATVDSARMPTFTLFAKPDYYLYAGKANCASPCVTEPPDFAWNHGTVSPDINTTWLGLVGPGVRNAGIDSVTWSDHTDIRPTMLALLGLRDDYVSDGRVLFEDLYSWAYSPSARFHTDTLVNLAQEYKRLNAPVGLFALASLKASTAALKSDDPGDATFSRIEGRIQSLTSQRNALASQMIAVLHGAEFGSAPVNVGYAQDLIDQGEIVFHQMDMLGATS
ncbi:MAG: hypothetical protein NVS2B16_04570 [Chloroflexota bacterium]